VLVKKTKCWLQQEALQNINENNIYLRIKFTNAILRLFQSHSTFVQKCYNSSLQEALGRTFCVHLQLLYLAGTIDVVGDGVSPSVRMSGDEIPPVSGNVSEH
jgi:hypothetical protein